MNKGKSEPTCVACPTCARTVEWTDEQRWRPFCSERCKLVDLGSWLDESHRIAGEEQASLPDELDIHNR